MGGCRRLSNVMEVHVRLLELVGGRWRPSEAIGGNGKSWEVIRYCSRLSRVV